MKKWVKIIAICFYFTAGFAWAELDFNKDQNEKATIVSQSADINRSTGISVFKDNVKIDQGSTHVKGDIITTYNDENNEVKEAIVEGLNGNLAQYQTVVEQGKPVLYAKAKIIKYYPQKKYIVLLGNASIVQGTDSIAGDELEYDIEKQHLISKNNKSSGQGRTTIIISPKSAKNGSLTTIKAKS